MIYKKESFKFYSIIKTTLIVGLLFFGITANASSEEEVIKEEFDMTGMIFHHIADANAIHLGGDVYMPLPVILYNKEKGLDFFMSNKLYDVDHGHLVPKVHSASSGAQYTIDSHGKIVEAGAANHHDANAEGDHAASNIIDFSITKSVFGMFLAMLIMFLIFRAVAKGYKKREGQAPKGIQNAMEPLIMFVRDDLVIPSVGKKNAHKFMPFLMTTFFFIWIANLMGLIPFIGGFNITGTLSITLVLAVIVFIVTTINGNKHYWSHILWPPGVPLPIKFILVPIEFLSIFIKPAVLMIRLTANITAGHIIILSFAGLILMAGQSSVGAGLGVAVGSVTFMIFMFFIELLVSFIQAFVFTLLAAIYFGDATQDGHH